MNIYKTIKKIENTANLKVIGIKRIWKKIKFFWKKYFLTFLF
jgi:hypothetical protein